MNIEEEIKPKEPAVVISTPVTPVTHVEQPSELPQTGLISGMGAFVSLDSVATAISYYGASRRSLLDAPLSK